MVYQLSLIAISGLLNDVETFLDLKFLNEMDANQVAINLVEN
jgi:hypothetical protein